MNNIPQSKYDENYYKHSCDGYTENGELCSRLQFFSNTINSFIGKISGYNIIDIGCGRGELSKYYSELGNNILSIDYSYSSIELFKKNVGDTISFLRHDISRGFPWLTDQYFDIIIMADVLEHLHHENMIQTGKEISRITRNGGFIFIDTPILKNGGSELHINVKENISDILQYFPKATLLSSSWYQIGRAHV